MGESKGILENFGSIFKIFRGLRKIWKSSGEFLRVLKEFCGSLSDLRVSQVMKENFEAILKIFRGFRTNWKSFRAFWSDLRYFWDFGAILE